MPNIYLWTGKGAGKTTSALGVALREVGHKQKVIIIQFMKGRKDIGEYLVKDMLKPYYEIYQFGRPGFVDLKDPSDEDKARAKKALEFAEKKAKQKPNLIILDEVNLACAIGLIQTKDVIRFINKVPKSVNIYLIGRYAPKELIEKADFVNVVKEVKHPKYWRAKIGIEY
jgi:cob(I)alamin adenosyltransferase